VRERISNVDWHNKRDAIEAGDLWMDNNVSELPKKRYIEQQMTLPVTESQKFHLKGRPCRNKFEAMCALSYMFNKSAIDRCFKMNNIASDP
jgi:hypothetical protein